MVWSIIGTASLGFVYAAFAKIDEVVVANGTLQAIGASRPIMSPAPGVVDEIYVKEGQSVRAGEPLLKFDPEVNETRQAALLEQLRLERQRFNEQERAYEAREQSLESRTRSLEASLQTEQIILTQIEPLVRQGGIQGVQSLQQKNKIQQLRSEIAQSQANLREVQAELVKLRQESLRNLSDLERQLFEVNKSLDYEELRAPVGGMVFELKPSSPGYAAQANETLLKVVPRGTLEAKVFLTNRDVGFVKPGQAAQIRIDAFPFTQFGAIPGRLKSIGTDSLPPDQQNPLPRFPAYVSLNRLYLEKSGTRHQVSSGQTVSVNLIVRDKRVITLLTDAVQRALDALRQIRSPAG
ncbi:HlyD family efflux transporter periplasmic adaptor subunit [Synechococcus sp. HK01-R]|nr:HlyD family efflux transporter periplasmic adaptor subunit [Synechococcus sp. HK01-R]